MDLLRSATSSELTTIKDICTLFGTFRVGVLRATSIFKFERDWRYLFIQIKKMAKEGRCSLHWLRGCGTRMYRSFPKNSSKKIRYLTLYLNTNSQSTSSYTQPPTSSALLTWIQVPDMFGYKNIITFQISPVDKTTFPHFLTKTTLLMMISEFRSTKFHKNIIYENLVS